MKNCFPKTVFRTPNPQFEVSEVYEIFIKPVPGAADLHECWIVGETHGWCDEVTKRFHYRVETVEPVDKHSFLTCEEAIYLANEQVLLRAKNGFRFLFVMNYTEPSPPWYERLEIILPGGEYRPLPEVLALHSVRG
ncbi:MAG: hypothetical protein WCE61_12000 [Candidatus Acidiferrum sp.]